ncbi:uncharacterized protein [Blastocystis hominis]|uniref:non-specific serine/threonine protein kinase n=1 Tax=Blastocystis hominis TaxID=12968 RepID=D8M710_BLAHO|nr:uncharacterized protein [Blastocystis hominis]CBK23849.2 unnamed protein product [Blastocystis hominis]|eukprot:XP_012897897.1 uncharacterized protein [Blastocystis hominis]
MFWTTFMHRSIYIFYFLNPSRIIHRDLKPENILLTSIPNTPLTDSERNSFYSPSRMYAMTQIGTPYYLAPEICQNRLYTNKVDIWSLGCIIFELMTGNPPFSGASISELFQNIQFSPIPSLPSRFPSVLTRLVRQLLSVDSNLRINFTEGTKQTTLGL